MKSVTCPLGDLVTIVGGGTPDRSNPQFWNGDIPWATVKDFKSNELSQTLERITAAGVDSSATNIIPVGSIIMPTRMALGKAAINTLPVAINQDLKALIIQEQKIDKRFLLHFLLSRASWIEGRGKGATVKGITIDVIKELMVPFPPLSKQKRIADILDKADGIRRKRQEVLELADEFLRSIFLDMFGDPVTNPKDWDSGTIEDVAAREEAAVRCGPFGTQLKVHELVSEGVPLLGIENVVNNHFDHNFTKFLAPDKAYELRAFAVKPGDILITRMGTIGRSCVVPENIGDARISYHLFRVRVDETKCMPEFLTATIALSGTFQTQLNRLARGAIMSGLNTSLLKEVRFLIPPIERQRVYVTLVTRTTAYKTQQSLSLDHSSMLFESLTQQAFRGEL